MKILITGARGFVGNAIRRELRKKDLAVRLLVRDKIEITENEELRIVDDIFELNVSEWLEILKDIDTVIHCAWYVKHSDYLASIENVRCMEGTLELVKAMSQKKACTFIGLGTCFEYDLTEQPLSPDTPEYPTCLYAECKLAVKRISWHLMQNSNSSIIWARLFYLFGPGEQSERLYPTVLRAVEDQRHVGLTHGTQIRDFLHIDEAAAQVCSFICYNGPPKVVNICSEKGQTVKEFLKSQIDENDWKLLKFGMRQENLIDPPVIIGRKKTKKQNEI